LTKTDGDVRLGGRAGAGKQMLVKDPNRFAALATVGHMAKAIHAGQWSLVAWYAKALDKIALEVHNGD